MSALGNLAQNLGGESGLLPLVLRVVQNRGGLAGIISAFQQHGMGDAVQSWISTGPNQNISGDQVTRVLGDPAVQQVAKEAGIAPEEAKSRIAELLPQIVDRMTPNGQVPATTDIVSQGMQMLKGKLFG